MYLKSLEVQGFKSFPDKTLIRFGDDITAIVGPNGSGKSNVADAVRWVLGEQSAKQLRGSSMQDVIFAGTQMRKPQGFAYVAITLDNSDHKLPVDYEEVTVARRVYRSGESEYLMNGVNCRLRDVQELFLDTGIGKEGYSIIGQGKVEEIMSAKEKITIQAIKRSMQKYALSDNHISKVIAPLSALPTVAIIDLIRVIKEMLVVSNVSRLSCEYIGKHIQRSGLNISTNLVICNPPPKADVLILLSTLSTASCSFIAFSWSACNLLSRS